MSLEFLIQNAACYALKLSEYLFQEVTEGNIPWVAITG